MSFSTLHQSIQALTITRPVPKTRRPKFDLHLKIIDLNNVPLVSGTSHVKWHLPSSSAAEHRGNTPKVGIRDHKVIWDYSKTLPVRLTVDRTGVLQTSEIYFEVSQEYSPGARAERIVLGTVKLNLSEFVDGSDDGEDAVTRRYLMQESKINSTLKIAIHMVQTEGDHNFIAPALKTAPVFGGIAGILTAEQGETDDGSNMPSMSSKAQESGKLQDMYRRNLAASWAAQSGELPADKCVEDLFAGGDGWGEQGYEAKVAQGPNGAHSDENSDGDRRTLRSHRRHASGGTVKKASVRSKKDPAGMGAVSGRASIEQQVQTSHDMNRPGQSKGQELNELDLRDDLRSWEISSYG